MTSFSNLKHVHLIGVGGTGMGAFAGLLKQAGYDVTGSDTTLYPPMSDKLKEWGIPTFEGYRRENLHDHRRWPRDPNCAACSRVRVN